MSRFWIENAQLAQAEAMSRAMILVGGYAVDPSEETARELRSAMELHSRIDPGAALLVLVRTPANDRERALLAGLPEAALPLCYEESKPGKQVPLPALPPYALIHVYGVEQCSDDQRTALVPVLASLIERHRQEEAGGRITVFPAEAGDLLDACAVEPRQGHAHECEREVDRAIHLTRAWCELETEAVRTELGLVARSFADVSLQLAELQKRRLLENRLQFVPAKAKSRFRYLTPSYWRDRTKRLRASYRKRHPR